MKLLGIGSSIEIGPYLHIVTRITATTVETRAAGFGPVEASRTPGKELTLTHAEVEKGLSTTQKKETKHG
tara:strand:+ start:2536 stop:2745 length:210 start_codon:yes stop_codon:yes gene_type:complete